MCETRILNYTRDGGCKLQSKAKSDRNESVYESLKGSPSVRLSPLDLNIIPGRTLAFFTGNAFNVRLEVSDILVMSLSTASRPDSWTNTPPQASPIGPWEGQCG